MSDDDSLYVDQNNLIGYIRTALDMDGITVTPDLIAHILDLEMEYLQHHGIAEEVVDDPRPE